MMRTILVSLFLLLSVAGQAAVRVGDARTPPALFLGAAKNGSTDETEALTAALARAGQTGAALHLGEGTYLVKSTLRIPRANRPISIVGGEHTTLLFSPDRPLDTGVLVSGISNVTLDSVTLRGGGAGLHHAISVDNASNIHLNDLHIEGIHGSGVSAVSAILLEGVNQVWITGSTITDVGDGPGKSAFAIWNYYKRYSQQVHIERNHISGNAAYIAIGLFDTDHAVVEDNTVDGGNTCIEPCNNNGYGVLFYRTGPQPASKSGPATPPSPILVDETILRNRITNTAGSAIYLQGVDNATVSGNTIKNTSSRMNDASLPAAGIALNGSSDIKILNNEIDNSKKAGIALATTKNVVVEGNRINTVATWGIHLRVSTTGTTIKQNTIAEALVGILIGRGAAGTTIEGNTQESVKRLIEYQPAP